MINLLAHSQVKPISFSMSAGKPHGLYSNPILSPQLSQGLLEVYRSDVLHPLDPILQPTSTIAPYKLIPAID